MKPSSDGKPEKPATGYKDKFWIPRFWAGMTVSAWFPLLVRNRCAVTPRRWAMALITSVLSFANFALWIMQQFFFARRVARTEIQHAPIFIVGHWRSGTTLLHELMILDARHTYPDTFACFAPNHFLATARLLKPSLRFLLPSRRPMDNMPAGWDRPQEDEFALCNMGVPSPYLTLAFPNHAPHDPQYLTLEGLSAKQLSHWKQSLLWFLKCVTLRCPKRIVLKSPPHTARIRVLLEMFPDARFIHVVRDPHVLFPSTMNLWKRLYRDQGLQVPNYEGLGEHVFETLQRMYEAFDRDRPSIGPNRFCEVRYEELIKDPVRHVQRIYDELQLGDFDQVLPALKQFVDSQKDYQTNRYESDPQLCAEIDRRWRGYLQRYGYPARSAQTNTSAASVVRS